MAYTSQVPAGNDAQQVNQKSGVVNIRGLIAVPYDGNDPPPGLLPGIGEDGIYIIPTTDGRLRMYNTITSSWQAVQAVNEIEFFTDIISTTPNGFIKVEKDNSNGGDGKASLYFIHTEDNVKTVTYIVGVDKKTFNL